MNPIVPQMAANLAATIRCFAQTRPEGTVEETDGLTLVHAGRELGFFNAALLSKPVLSEEEFRCRVRAAAEYFRAIRSEWCFWICEGLLTPGVLRGMADVLASAGLRTVATTPGLAGMALPPPGRDLPELAVRPVADEASRSSFCHLMRLVFQGPNWQISEVYGSRELWKNGFRGYVGTFEGIDAVVGATVDAGGVQGIYAVATLPHLRRRGLAEALMRFAIADTGGGEDKPLVLQSTQMALRLYTRLGFRQVTTFSVFSR